MSEYVAGVAERDALGRASASVLAQRRAYFQRLESIAALDELGVAEHTRYRSTESLIADRDNLDFADAKRLVAEAEDLCARRSLLGEALPARLPCTGAALAAGVIDPAHVKIIRDTMEHLSGLSTPPPPDELAGVEATLAEKAQELPPQMLRKLAKAFVDGYDPDGAAPPEGENTRDELRFLRRKDGSLTFKGTLHDPLDAEATVEVFGVLSARAGADDERSLERRQADAFKDLTQDARGPRGLATDARREHDAPEGADDDDPGAPANAADGSAPPSDTPADPAPEASDADADAAGDETGEAPLALIPEPRRPESAETSPGWTERPGRALLTITIDHRWLCEALRDKRGYGTLDSGHHVDAATVRRWACDAEIIPMVLGAKSEPLDVGRTQRTAPDAIRRALNHRDGGCAFPGCTRRPRRCEAHHVREWLQHRGATALDNMCLLCRHHHQLLHHGHWTIQMINGRPWFTPPWFIDPARRPRPGGRPRVPT
ncbi:uncharacterized protein DUF222 [Actinomycetospora succinea]|uniref:Uncharacterized protein DUF222 n=1 Tax=Actinomycetospora succinea TaxID=663603 RepID=A0A4V3DB11_9PSEU|nr:HNH endonuclease signature motif containing protein [Actinomycetospora succinea]TDQ64768.1 uncharacterized protein DUF222 [Actinomycetospora succinea]